MAPKEVPGLNLTDSVQVGHNAIGPTTGDIIINSGSNHEICSMCKTPIDAVNNPGLFCFSEGCDTLFCTNCESFFRESREPGEPPYCAEHIDLATSNESPPAPQTIGTVAGAIGVNTNSVSSSLPPPQAQMMGSVHQSVPMQMGAQVFGKTPHPGALGIGQHNPYLNQRMIGPLEALRRTVGNWTGEGRAQRSEYWLGGPLYMMMLFTALFIAMAPSGDRFYDDSYAVIGCLSLISYIPLISLTIRRLHDVGYSGWMILIGIIPWIGAFALFILFLMPSERHPNRYG